MQKVDHIFEAIASSKIFLAVGTTDLLEELRDDKSDPAQQVKMAKALRKRVILLLESNLSPGQKDELRTIFNDFDTVREVIFDLSSHNWDELRVAFEEMKLIPKQKVE